MRSMLNGMGWRLSDNKCSGGKREENDILGCSHCQALMIRTSWASKGGYCTSCDKPVCQACADLIPRFGCSTFLKTLETSLEKEYRAAQNRIVLGI